MIVFTYLIVILSNESSFTFVTGFTNNGNNCSRPTTTYCSVQASSQYNRTQSFSCHSGTVRIGNFTYTIELFLWQLQVKRVPQDVFLRQTAPGDNHQQYLKFINSETHVQVRSRYPLHERPLVEPQAVTPFLSQLLNIKLTYIGLIFLGHQVLTLREPKLHLGLVRATKHMLPVAHAALSQLVLATERCRVLELDQAALVFWGTDRL